MQNNPNEFVFKRKRRRIRIESLDMEVVDQTKDSRLIPEIAILAEPPTSSPTSPDDPILPSSNTDAACSESVITVERFLRSVEAAPQTNPKLKEKRAYNDQRARKASKKPTPKVARSLYRAAVLTESDPLDTLAEEAGVSLARRPLKFVPHNKFTSPSRRPRTRGKDRGEEVVPHTRHAGNPSNLKASHHAPSVSKRIPLTFVPFREAEVAYAAMFPRTRPSAHDTHS